MKKGHLTNSSRGAVATGASAAGAASFGAMALGAAALGAVAVGALAIGRLSVGRARLRRLEIGELAIGRIRVGAEGADRLTAVARIRSAPGQGDALQGLLRDHAAESEPGALVHGARRSGTDPDLFLFCKSYADAPAFERLAQAPRLDDFLSRAAEEGLVAADRDHVAIEFFHSI